MFPEFMVLEVQEHDEIDYKYNSYEHNNDDDCYLPLEHFRVLTLLRHQQLLILFPHDISTTTHDNYV